MLKTPRSMRIQKRNGGPRDQGLSVFSPILSRLCDASDAIAAALVDAEGETVDYSGRVSPFDVRVAAAEWRLILAMLQEVRKDQSRAWADVYEVVVRARDRSFALWALSEGYALVVVLPRHAFRISKRALAQAAEELHGEAGLLPHRKPERLKWSRVDVRPEMTDPKRPEAVWQDGEWNAVTVLGRLDTHELASLEIGYLARAASGRELLLVREAFGKWFAGDPL